MAGCRKGRGLVGSDPLSPGHVGNQDAVAEGLTRSFRVSRQCSRLLNSAEGGEDAGTFKKWLPRPLLVSDFRSRRGSDSHFLQDTADHSDFRIVMWVAGESRKAVEFVLHRPKSVAVTSHRGPAPPVQPARIHVERHDGYSNDDADEADPFGIEPCDPLGPCREVVGHTGDADQPNDCGNHRANRPCRWQHSLPPRITFLCHADTVSALPACVTDPTGRAAPCSGDYGSGGPLVARASRSGSWPRGPSRGLARGSRPVPQGRAGLPKGAAGCGAARIADRHRARGAGDQGAPPERNPHSVPDPRPRAWRGRIRSDDTAVR